LKDFESQRILNPGAILSPGSPDLADADKGADQLTVPRAARLLPLIRPPVLPCPLCANIGCQETDTLVYRKSDGTAQIEGGRVVWRRVLTRVGASAGRTTSAAAMTYSEPSSRRHLAVKPRRSFPSKSNWITVTGRPMMKASQQGPRDVILGGLPERPELFTVSIGIDCDLLNQVVQMIERACYLPQQLRFTACSLLS
jgi:hypothetical protein